jgi:delta 1-pyrroline-5-carboxylate dehydrogenase
MMHVQELHATCRYGLTAAIFGDEDEARAMAQVLRVGSVLVNDLIVPTADPRVPFGGRGASGFGVTRGAEGLLEMTAVKTVLVRRSGSLKHLDATNDEQATMFAAMIGVLHGRTWTSKWKALRELIRETRR